jgi:hypothetical protein
MAELPYSHVCTIDNDTVDPVTMSTRGRLLRWFDRAAANARLAAVGSGISVPLSLVKLRHMAGRWRGRPHRQTRWAGGLTRRWGCG